MIMFYLGLSCMVTGSLGTLGAGAWVWASGRDWALASLISMVGGVDNLDSVDNVDNRWYVSRWAWCRCTW